MARHSDRPYDGRTLLWCLRHFSWVILVCVLVGAAAPLLVAPSERTYQADALVVARQLTVNARVLPLLAESVFRDGAVATAVRADPAVDDGAPGVVPEKVSVVTGPNSITMVVQARDADPATAARLANVAADAFAEELNRGGSGVGQFAVQNDSVLPTAPLQVVSDTVRAGLGALAGVVLGLGIIALIAAVSRPSVTAGDVTDAVGVPLLGTVELRPAPPGTYLGPRGVGGIGTVTRWLATAPSGRLLLVSPPAATGLRRRVYVMVAIALSQIRPVQLRASEEIKDVVGRQAPVPDGGPSSRTPKPTGDLVLVDGGSSFEVLDPAGTPVSVVAVAPVGISRSRLRALAQDYLNGGLVGVILVKRRLGRRPTAGRTAKTQPAVRRTRPARDVPAPEPA